MSFETKLDKILKWEVASFLVFLFITVIFIPYIIQFSKTNYTTNKVISIILIIVLFIILINILIYKIYIIVKVIWSKNNYMHNYKKVRDFLKHRRASLITIRGNISCYNLYNDALKMIEDFISNK